MLYYYSRSQMLRKTTITEQQTAMQDRTVQ